MEENRTLNSGRAGGPMLPPTRKLSREENERLRQASAGLRMPGSNTTVDSKVRQKRAEDERRTRQEIQQRKREAEERRFGQEQRYGQERFAGTATGRNPYIEEEKGMKKNGNRTSQKALAQKRKIKRLWGILGAEVMVLGLLIIGYGIFYINHKMDQMNYNEIDDTDLSINEGLSALTREEYTTIALFGLDSRDVTSDTGNRSDTIIIASLNNKTKEVKLVSVYRDCYLELANPTNGNYDGLYTKITHAYAYGGPKAAVATMNKNLDLQITEYATVNFASLTDVINELGGITVNVDEAERQSVNIWLPETAEIAGMSYSNLYETGDVTLDGLQAVTYCRIRNIGNGDIDRAGRQREVLGAILDKAKQSDLMTLNRVLDDVLPNISTSLSKKEILGLMTGVFEYEVTDNEGFPFIYSGRMAYDQTMGRDLSMDVPANLERNVELLHEFLFDVSIVSKETGGTTSSELTGVSTEEGAVSTAPEETEGNKKTYTPSDEVIRISNEIQESTGLTPPEDPEFRGGF